MMALAFGLMSMYAFGLASASTFDDAESGLADTLGVQDSVAGLIIASAVLLSVALVLAVARMNLNGTMIVLLVVLLAMVAIGWLPYWTVILVVFMVVGLFGSFIADWFSGDRRK
jgi:cell division protein FtsW (lipid II flippase)